ncbi:MAG: hypothetical protein KDJ65_20020 [Anaerolineae bacterium]|nr:hypothetical protein [Anaerolineae bacterium]
MFEKYPNLLTSCAFDKTATGPIIAFEIFILVGTIAALFILRRFTDKVWQRYAIVAAGVLIFEFFTTPMWNNHNMGPWAYVYQDVSWILMLGWSTLVLGTVVLVDHFLAQMRVWQRFVAYLVVLTILVIFFEGLVINLGIRTYSPEVQAVFWGPKIFGVNIEVLYYVPVFMALVISFYKYWSLSLDDALIAPVKKRHWLGSFVISLLGVFLFELMIEPMVINANLPAWSYIYHDVSFLMTGLWVLIIWLTLYAVDRLLINFGLVTRFLVYLGVIGVLVLPIEAWFIHNGYRLYGPSATANFTGFETIFTNVPVEVAFAVPLYLALVITFIRFWEINLENPFENEI